MGVENEINANSAFNLVGVEVEAGLGNYERTRENPKQFEKDHMIF